MKKLVALACVAAVVATFKFLPWWAGVGLVVSLGLAARLLIGTVFKRFFLGLFEAKSAVLRGASARLHTIAQAPEPKRELGDEFDQIDEMAELAEAALEPTPRAWRYVDVTITVPEPAADSDECGLTMWEPGELTIVEASAKPGKANGLDGFDDDLGEVHSVDIMQGGNWVPLEGDKVFGSQRLRLHVGVRPGVDEFRLRYYFEILKNAGKE